MKKSTRDQKIVIAAQVYARAVNDNDDCDSSYYQEWLEKELGTDNLWDFLNKHNLKI